MTGDVTGDVAGDVSRGVRGHVLVVRLDSMGDALVCGPAVRAVAASADRVTMLVSTRSAATAALLPAVDDLMVWDCPWITHPPPPVREADVERVVCAVRRAQVDEALILTSYHQSALPTALLLRLSGVARIHAVSTDHPGTLLTTRLPDPPDAPEAQRMLALAGGAGFPLPAGDDGRLAITDPGPPPAGAPDGPFLVVHPGTDAPARAYPTARWQRVVERLVRRGHQIVVTGGPQERAMAERIAEPGAIDLCGRTSVAELAALLRRATVLLAANTGPAHLAAAVGTPVVSLFAPVVPAIRWAPFGVPTVVLGDQRAACRGSRVRDCVVAGHPCLSNVEPAAVVAAAEHLAESLVGA